VAAILVPLPRRAELHRDVLVELATLRICRAGFWRVLGGLP
jgi:hypothetical protein